MSAQSHDYSFYASGEFWGFDDTGFHGIGIADLRLDLGARDELRLTLNTDTATVRYRAGFDSWELGLYARGEFLVAGLLQDYYVGGQRIPEFGFDASYAEGGFDAKWGLGSHFIHGRLAARKWFFAENETAEFYVLPPDFVEGEAELGYTYWGIAADASFSDAHRIVFDRVDGFGFGLRFVASYRDNESNWGLGIRNNPEAFIPRVRQWSKFGWRYAESFRVQLAQESGAGINEDDITRARIGGLNPYVVRVAGVPWAAFLSSRYGSMRLSHHVRVFGDAEWVVIADGAAIWDLHRAGRDEFSPVLGFATGLDWRFGRWQIDALAAFSPDTGWQEVESPLMSFYAGVGYGY